MVYAARGSVKGISWHSRRLAEAAHPIPLFAANDNGDIDYRALAAASGRLWRDHAANAPLVAAARAQSAFWQGRMATCRWWHSVARMLDRALVAGHCLQGSPDSDGSNRHGRAIPANR